MPLSIDTCRCGAPRPEDAGIGETSSSPPEEPVTGDGETHGLPKGVLQLGGLVLVVALYFGSRSCNRWQTSREARAAAIEGLSEATDAETARMLVDLHHAECFEETYRTGWGRRQASKFDEEQYVGCIIRGVEKQGKAMRAAAPQPGRVPLRLPMPTPPPTPPATPEPDYGLITVGDFAVKEFKSQPKVRLVFTFVALGRPEAIEHKGSCYLDLRCGGQRVTNHLSGNSDPTRTDCPLKLEGSVWKGSMAMAWDNSTPAQGECTLHFGYVHASRWRSNELVIDLKETPGP